MGKGFSANLVIHVNRVLILVILVLNTCRVWFSSTLVLKWVCFLEEATSSLSIRLPTKAIHRLFTYLHLFRATVSATVTNGVLNF